MIAKIHTGNNFGGLVNYANDIVKKDTEQKFILETTSVDWLTMLMTL